MVWFLCFHVYFVPLVQGVLRHFVIVLFLALKCNKYIMIKYVYHCL